MKPAGAPYIYIDCGIGDNELIASNREVVAALHKAGVAYEYHEVAGAHTWDYWDRQIREFLPVLMKKMANLSSASRLQPQGQGTTRYTELCSLRGAGRNPRFTRSESLRSDSRGWRAGRGPRPR